MRQADLERSVARATGESVGCIRQLGFSLIVMPTVLFKAGEQLGVASTRAKTRTGPIDSGRRERASSVR
jgi:hypothetical protein